MRRLGRGTLLLSTGMRDAGGLGVLRFNDAGEFREICFDTGERLCSTSARGRGEISAAD